MNPLTIAIIGVTAGLWYLVLAGRWYGQRAYPEPRDAEPYERNCGLCLRDHWTREDWYESHDVEAV